MAVPFDEAERRRITDLLLQRGEILFASQGLRKTSLAELVAPAGIATSSFYSFFAAKEAVYLELMVRRAPAIGRLLEEALAQRPTRSALVAVMRTTARVLEEDPLYRRLLTHPDELAAVGRRLGHEQLQRIEPHLLRPLTDFIERAQHAGELVPASSQVVVSVLRAVGLVVMNRAEYGEAYPEVLDLTIESLATGLVTTRGNRRAGRDNHGQTRVSNRKRVQHE